LDERSCGEICTPNFWVWRTRRIRGTRLGVDIDIDKEVPRYRVPMRWRMLNKVE
jgi:hypothetical protein